MELIELDKAAKAFGFYLEDEMEHIIKSGALSEEDLADDWW